MIPWIMNTIHVYSSVCWHHGRRWWWVNLVTAGSNPKSRKSTSTSVHVIQADTVSLEHCSWIIHNCTEQAQHPSRVWFGYKFLLMLIISRLNVIWEAALSFMLLLPRPKAPDQLDNCGYANFTWPDARFPWRCALRLLFHCQVCWGIKVALTGGFSGSGCP